MQFLRLFFVIALLAVCQADVVVSFVDENGVMKDTVEREWSCRASSFPQYLSSILSDASFPSNCVAPGIDVFQSVNVVYLEELASLNAIPSQGEMNVTEVDTIVTPLNSFYKGSNGIQRICLNENSNGCPNGFQLVSNVSLLNLENQTFIYRPLHLNTSMWENVKTLAAGKNLLGMFVEHGVSRYTNSEVVDVNIIFVTAIILVLLMAVTVYVVATIDYGEDTAGLYSKYKQVKSQ